MRVASSAGPFMASIHESSSHVSHSFRLVAAWHTIDVTAMHCSLVQARAMLIINRCLTHAKACLAESRTSGIHGPVKTVNDRCRKLRKAHKGTSKTEKRESGSSYGGMAFL